MLQIRSDQMAAFSAKRRDQFVAYMNARLLEIFPEELKRFRIPRDGVEPFVREGIERAGHYGIRKERDVEFFVDCLLIYHPRFDDEEREAWAAEILRDGELSGSQKMDRIHDHWIFRQRRTMDTSRNVGSLRRDGEIQ